MDQSAPGLDRAKSSRSCDQWISVNPTERGRRLGCILPHASLSLPFEHVSLSHSLWISRQPMPFTLCYTFLSRQYVDTPLGWKFLVSSVQTRSPTMGTQSLVTKWFRHLRLMTHSNQNHCANGLISSCSWCHSWKHISPRCPSQIAKLYLHFSHFHSCLSSPAKPTCLAVGSEKNWGAQTSLRTGHAVSTWQRETQWFSTSPLLILLLHLGHSVPGNSCLTSMPRPCANPKTLLLSRKPGITLPFHATVGQRGARRVMWRLPTRLNAKRHHGLTWGDRETTDREEKPSHALRRGNFMFI